MAREGQEPTELFITCSDSRVVPTLFTSSGPGDLFKVRNIGNIVPPCSHNGTETVGHIQGDAAIASAIEYALMVLHVKNIVVCGHSGCGAMKALLDTSGLSAMPHVQEWLRYGDPTLTRFNATSDFDPSRPVADQLAQVNVVQQLENLRTYPLVREYEAQGKVRLTGMFFDIEKAAVLLWDRDTERFVAVEGAVEPIPVAA